MDEELVLRALQGRATRAELRALNAWRRTSAANERAYQQMVRLWDVTGTAELAVRTNVPTGAAVILAGDGSASVRKARTRRRTRWLAGVTAAAASVALILAGVNGLYRRAADAGIVAIEAVTSPFETRSLELPDGSVVRLGPASRLRYEERSGIRSAEFAGHAYFGVVRHDSPFVVRTARGETRVLGTRFEILANDRNLRVLVIDGRVAVQTPVSEEVQLGAGDMAIATIEDAPAVSRLEPTEVAALLEWLGATLVFQETPLRDVVREIEQHYGMTVEFDGEGVADRTVMAWFDNAPLEEVLAVVCRVTATRCAVSDNRITMTADDVESEHR